MVAPVYCLHAVIKLVGVVHGKARQHQQHAVGQARPQAQAIGHFDLGMATYCSSLLAHLLQAQRLGLFQQQAFKPFGAGQYDFVTFRHGCSTAYGNQGGTAMHLDSK